MPSKIFCCMPQIYSFSPPVTSCTQLPAAPRATRHTPDCSHTHSHMPGSDQQNNPGQEHPTGSAKQQILLPAPTPLHGPPVTSCTLLPLALKATWNTAACSHAQPNIPDSDQQNNPGQKQCTGTDQHTFLMLAQTSMPDPNAASCFAAATPPQTPLKARAMLPLVPDNN